MKDISNVKGLQVKQFKKMEKKRIPEDIDYEDVGSLRIEAKAKQKLSKIRPSSIDRHPEFQGCHQQIFLYC